MPAECLHSKYGIRYMCEKLKILPDFVLFLCPSPEKGWLRNSNHHTGVHRSQQTVRTQQCKLPGCRAISVGHAGTWNMDGQQCSQARERVCWSSVRERKPGARLRCPGRGAEREAGSSMGYTPTRETKPLAQRDQWPAAPAREGESRHQRRVIKQLSPGHAAMVGC